MKPRGGNAGLTDALTADDMAFAGRDLLMADDMAFAKRDLLTKAVGIKFSAGQSGVYYARCAAPVKRSSDRRGGCDGGKAG